MLADIINNSNNHSIIAFIKHNKELQNELIDKTKYLNNFYVYRDITQRLYHYMNDIKIIPRDKHGWYKKFESLDNGYGEKLQPVRLGEFSKLSVQDITNYICSVESIPSDTYLIEFIKNKTNFLDPYNPSIPLRLSYIKENINHPIFTTEKHTTLLKPTRKPKKYIIDNYRQYLAEDNKILFVKKWLLSTGSHRKRITKSIKAIPMICDYINAFAIEHKLDITDYFQISYHMVYNITTYPNCSCCGKSIDKKRFNSHYCAYPKTCSMYCNNILRENIQKRLIANKTNSGNFNTNIGKNEEYLLRLISKLKKLNITKTHRIGSYFVDGIDIDKHICIEVQEKYHLYKNRFEKDKTKFEHIIINGYNILCVFDLTGINEKGLTYLKYIEYFKNKYNEKITFISILPSKTKILTQNGWSIFCGIKKSNIPQNTITIQSKNNQITCTPKHLLLCNEKFISAKDIKVGDVLDSFDDINKNKIINIHNTTERIVYDVIETEDNTFIYNNLIIHNCIIIDECLGGSETIDIKNKQTGEIRTIPIEHLLLEEYK